jgi:hypothetical protein
VFRMIDMAPAVFVIVVLVVSVVLLRALPR